MFERPTKRQHSKTGSRCSLTARKRMIRASKRLPLTKLENNSMEPICTTFEATKTTGNLKEARKLITENSVYDNLEDVLKEARRLLTENNLVDNLDEDPVAVGFVVEYIRLVKASAFRNRLL